jgi:polyhydroxyalkanoate synthesis repressor PhaR
MASASDDDVVTIKKYANRRLYNTESSTYITLEHLAEMVRKKREFRVVDAKSGEDLTRGVLTQIIMEEESRGTTMLPVNFLRQLIGMYGDSMQAMVPGYLEASLESFQRNQSQFRDAMAGALTGGPFVDLAKRNMELFAAAVPKPSGTAEAEPARSKEEEMAELKRQLAELQSKVDKLAG